MANKVALVTDSTADPRREWVEKYNIPIAKTLMIWDGEGLRDYFALTAEEFFSRLATSDTLPTTSQPSPSNFKEINNDLLSKGYDILEAHVSHKLSGTAAPTEQAKAMFPEANKVMDMVNSRLECEQALITDFSPTLGTHTGSGTIAIASIAGYDYP